MFPKKDIQTEVVSTMVEKYICLREGKGRALSYFTGIVAKNHLILKNNGNYKRWRAKFTTFRSIQHGIRMNDFYK